MCYIASDLTSPDSLGTAFQLIDFFIGWALTNTSQTVPPRFPWAIQMCKLMVSTGSHRRRAKASLLSRWFNSWFTGIPYPPGANIDKGHHSNRARFALEETLALDDAVEVMMKETSSDDTLIVISADHSHAMAFGGRSCLLLQKFLPTMEVLA